MVEEKRLRGIRLAGEQYDGELYNPTSMDGLETKGAMDLLVPMLVRGEGVEISLRH